MARGDVPSWGLGIADQKMLELLEMLEKMLELLPQTWFESAMQ